MEIVPTPQELRGHPESPCKETSMKLRILTVLLTLLLLLPACASQKEVRVWKPGDSVICPYSGREFPLPEKLGE
jgi:hypothetical protein